MKNLHTCDFFPPSSASADHVMVVTKKSHDVKNPRTTAEKSLVYLHYYYFFCVGDLKLSQEQKHNAPPGFSFSGDL